MPGVLLCPTHGLPLRPAFLPRIDQHGFVAATAESCRDQPIPPPLWAENPKIMALLGRLARQSAALLDASPVFVNFADLTAHRRAQFIAAGFASASGRLRIDALAKAAGVKLGLLCWLFPEAESLRWILAMGRKHRHAFSPLQHLLLDLVLEEGAPSLARRRPLKRRFLAEDADFEAKLRETAGQARSLREAARRLGVDPQTILKHAARLQLEGPWRLRPAPEAKPEACGAKEENRRAWLEAGRCGRARTGMRRERPAAWVWLKRHDADWLEAHSPPPRRPRSDQPRVDWRALDERLAGEIRLCALEIGGLLPPLRRTRSEIERRLDRRGWFGPRRAKLPLCAAAFEDLCESLEDFRLRRVAWAQADLLAQGIAPKLWRVQRKAGLPPSLSPRIAAALIERGSP